MCEQKTTVEERKELIALEKQELSLMRNKQALEELKDSSRIPRSMNGKLALAAEFSKSNLLPGDYAGRPENCFIALQFGEMLGFSNPMSCFQNVYVVKGKPSASADSMIAAVFNHPDFMDYQQEGDEKQSITTITRKLKSGKEKSFSMRHTIQMSKDKLKAGSQWDSDPALMLKHRSDAKACRAAFPEIFAGIHTLDELQNVVEVQDGKGNRIDQNFEDLMPKEKPVVQDNLTTEIETVDLKIEDPISVEITEEKFPYMKKETPKKVEKPVEETPKKVDSKPPIAKHEMLEKLINKAKSKGVDVFKLKVAVKEESGKDLEDLTVWEMENIIKDNFGG